MLEVNRYYHLQHFNPMARKVDTLINQQNGELAFQILSFYDLKSFEALQRHSYYSIILIHEGTIDLQIERNPYHTASKTIICISPYQPYAIKSSKPVQGVILNFHPDFFCTYKHQNEIQTEGILFHNIFQPSFFRVADEKPLLTILDQMSAEIANEDIGQHQQLVSYLKIFLLSVVRIKKHHSTQLDIPTNNSPQIILELINHIEMHYQQKHSTLDYANMLNISTSALGKLVKKHFGKTLSNLIAERILVEAKRELYLTSKTVKEIAYMFGYGDEYYFSRFFKKHAGISPSIYRNTVGFAKLES